MILKIRNRPFDISDKDRVLFNGSCWQLITQTYCNGWYSCCPTMSKTLCEKFVKKNILIFIKREGVNMDYYKFDIDKLGGYLNDISM